MKTFLLLGLLWLVQGAVAAEQNVAPFYLSQLRLAWRCYTNADYSNSVAHYQAAIKAAPQSLEARLGCLLPSLALERFADAESLARQVLKEHPANYHASLRLAFALRMQDRLEQAEEVLQRALALHPTDVSCLRELALVKLARKQDATARRLFADVLTLSPSNGIALDQLASPRLLHEPADAPLPRPWAFSPGLRPPPDARQVHAATAAYYAYLDYQHTFAKDHAHAAGLYASLGYGPEHCLEVEADYLHKFYRGYPSLQQWDTTLAYANFSIPRAKLRLGGHLVTSEDPFTDQGWVVFGGSEYYAGSRWAAGLDGSFTKYPKFQAPLQVIQLAPHLGLTLWQGAHHNLNNDLRGYWIHLNQDTFGPRDCFSLEDRLSLNWRRCTFSAFGWAGEQLFAVRNDGFAVFNLAEKHKGGYGVEARYAVSDRVAVTLRASREYFRDLAITPNAWWDLYLAMLSVDL